MAMSTVTTGRRSRCWRRCVLTASLATACWAAPSPAGAGSPDDDGLVIVDAGDPTNRVSLLPVPQAGAAAEIVSAETFVSSAVDETGEVLGEFTASLDSQQTMVVVDVRADGGFVARSRVDSADVDGDAELILGLDFAELVGLSWDSVVAPDGVVVESDLLDNGRLTDTARSLTEGLPTSLMALVPLEPVGEGARWTIEVDDFAGSYAYDCRLVAVAGGRFRVEFEYRIDTMTVQDGTEARAVTVGHGDFDGSLTSRLDGATRLADTTTVTLDADDADSDASSALTDGVTMITEYTAATVSRPIGGA